MLNETKTTTLPELTAMLLARLGFLWLIVLVSVLLPGGDPAFYAFMGVAFIITIPYSLWLRDKLRATRVASLQFIVDLVMVTGLVYFTGGAHSELTLLYPLVILSAGIIGTPKQAAEITVLAITTYALLIVALANHWLVEFLPSDQVVTAGGSAAAVLTRGVTFMCFGGASVYVAKRCAYSNERDLDLVETTHRLLRGVPAPSLLLDETGAILFANDALLRVIGAERMEELPDTFADLCSDHEPAPPAAYGKTALLKQMDAGPLPVSYEAEDLFLLDTALRGSEGRKDEERRVTLMTFTDLSIALDRDQRLERVERVQAASKIASDMAHEIRTPLTAISASIQLLCRYEERTTAADWLPNSPKRLDRRELFEHIEDASARMNDAITNFINFAEFSPADLLSIIKLDSIDENQGYIGHLNTVGRGFPDGQNIDRG